MSLPFRSFFVGKRIRDICDIQSYPSKIDEKVTPVVVVNPAEQPAFTGISERGYLKYYDATVTPSGTGLTSVDITVPTGKKWIIKAFNSTSTGTMTINGVDYKIYRVASTEEITINSAATSGSYMPTLNLQIPESWVIRFRFSLSAYTSGSVVAKILVQEITETQ